MHAGEFDVQNIGGRKELIGQDIIVATRLLKDSVPVREYVIATPAAPGVAEAAGVMTRKGRDELESIGPMEYFYVDLGPVRDAYQKSKTFYVSPEQADLTVAIEIEAPTRLVWETASKLDQKKFWQLTVTNMEHIQGEPDSLGEVHSCIHGASKIVHACIAIDQENMKKTERTWISPAIMKDIYVTAQVIPLSDAKSRCEIRATLKPAIPLLSSLARPLLIRLMKSDLTKDMARLKEFCETGKVTGREAQPAKHPA